MAWAVTWFWSTRLGTATLPEATLRVICWVNGTTVPAGGVGANRQLRATLDDEARRKRFRVFYPELEFCTDNGAMIALAGCLRLQSGTPAKQAGDFAVQPRWPLMDRAASGTK